jgi:hypothetical protein
VRKRRNRSEDGTIIAIDRRGRTKAVEAPVEQTVQEAVVVTA